MKKINSFAFLLMLSFSFIYGYPPNSNEPKSSKINIVERTVFFLFDNLFQTFQSVVISHKQNKYIKVNNLEDNQPFIKETEFSYGSDKKEKLNYIYSLNNKEKKLIPFIHIHGGGWVTGNKKGAKYILFQNLIKNGLSIFSLDYPLSPKISHPKHLQSLLKSLVWIKKQYPEYKEVHLYGESAGGHLAMMLAIYISNEELLKKIDPSISIYDLPKIKSITDVYGVNDKNSWIEDKFPLASSMNKAYLGKNSNPEIIAYPMDFKNINKIPPTFIIGAEKDALFRSSKIWFEKISQQFNEVIFKKYNKKHGFMLSPDDEVLFDILAFLNNSSKVN